MRLVVFNISEFKFRRLVMERYDIQANRRLAVWKQKMTVMKPLVHAAIVEDEAKKHGLPLESIVGGDVNAIVKMPCMKNEMIERRCADYEERLVLAEKLVHAYFVLEAASKDNIDVSKLALDPVRLFAKERSKVHIDREVQVDFGCANCASFIEDVDSWEMEVCRIVL
jgi:hypothetical protein